MYYNILDLPPSQQFLIQKKAAEVQGEQLAIKINAVEDLYAFKATIQQSNDANSKGLAQECQNKIDSILKDALQNDIDIPATLMNFFKARDSNVIFEYLKHLKNDVLRTAEESQ